MMKIGILTFHYTNNAGSVLQAYALQYIVRSMGVECNIVNYQVRNWLRTQAEEDFETEEHNRLRELQLLEFEMLKKIAEICAQNNLQYFLAEGTLLGAVRHQGFIPWDDDTDICMPREDFEKFIEIASHEMPDRYTYRLQHDKGLWGTLEIIDKNPEICGALDEQELHLVDIFPVDGFPQSKFKQKIHWLNILFRHCMLRFDQIDYIDKNKKRGFFWESAIKLAAKFPFGKFIDQKKSISTFNRCAKEICVF